MQSILAVAVLSAVFLPAADTFSPDTDGFIRNWLVLAPIPLPEDSGASEIDRDLIKGEAAVMPKAGDKVAVGGAELVWQPQQASDYFLDFVTAYGTVRGEDAAAYAVAYVMADEEMKVTLSVGSNDQCKAWLNGKQVVKFAETRTLEKDTEKAEVTLAKGQNVLVFKVINEKNSWQGAARFLKDGVAVRNVKIALAPQ